MAPPLTEGILEQLLVVDPKDPIWESTPTLQFLSIKLVGNANTTPAPADGDRPDRYRIIISDGQHFLQAMLATQLNDMVQTNVIGKNTIATIEKMVCNTIGGKRLVVILGLRVEEQSPPKIGEPKPLNPPNDAAATAPVSSSAPSTSANVSAPIPSAPAPSRGQAARSGKEETVYPIEALSPYQNNWTIKARVTQKSDIRTYSNQRGDGKFFSVTFMDDSGDIKGTAFNAACEELYNKVQEGKVYYVSKARVDIAKKKFGSNNQYELSLNVTTEIREVTDATSFPVIKYNFVTLQDLNNIEKDQFCDVLAVVKEIGDVGSITTKAGKPLTKRELSLVDQSNFAVRMTLWGKQAEQFQASEQDIMAFKGVKVGDFGGRSLSMMSSSVMEVNPDTPEAHSLKGWYMDGGADTTFQAYSGGGGSGQRSDQMRTVADAKAQTAEVSEKAEYFSIRATVMNVKPENIAYPACPSKDCNKKVTEEGGMWRCEKCDKSYPAPEYRYIISMAVADMTDEIWLQGFNDAGNIVLGKTADELTELRERDDAAFMQQMGSASGKSYVFTVRAKQDTYNDRTRVRYGIVRIEPVDYVKGITDYLTLLNSSWAQ
ncbi:replication factor-a protein [Peniophora sp. CONT]|nr:replication factor-a protein [Peniophora sp. CONT]